MVKVYRKSVMMITIYFCRVTEILLKKTTARVTMEFEKALMG